MIVHRSMARVFSHASVEITYDIDLYFVIRLGAQDGATAETRRGYEALSYIDLINSQTFSLAQWITAGRPRSVATTAQAQRKASVPAMATCRARVLLIRLILAEIRVEPFHHCRLVVLCVVPVIEACAFHSYTTTAMTSIGSLGSAAWYAIAKLRKVMKERGGLYIVRVR
jgi:hypothetical protein